jgi:hypothetical protein
LCPQGLGHVCAGKSQQYRHPSPAGGAHFL